MSQRRFEPGTVLADKYRLDALLGEGGMGTVYRATHLLLRAPVAIKVIDREVSSGDVALARFMREAQAAAALRSPHVVQVLDYGSAEGSPFMVMELLEGETLAQRIEHVGRLSPGETYRVMNHVARAVAKAHEAGIVHRDLKPDNVFLVHNEGDQLAKVLDFGVAKVEATALGGGSHTRTGSLLGTPYYMSPEQAQGNKEVDHRSDLWALAVIAFECLTGKRPFFSDGLGDIVLQICVRDIPRPSSVGEVPDAFDDWFLHATQREPGDRFQSAKELSEALREALGVKRDPTGSVPESQWSAAASLPGSRFGAPGVPDAATERDGDPVKPNALTMLSADSTRSLSADSTRSAGGPAEAPVPDVVKHGNGEGGARWEEAAPAPVGEVTAPTANWRVVPIGPSDRPPSLPIRIASDPPPTRSRALGVFFVAMAALSLGAGLVFLARSYGSDFVIKTLRGETLHKVPRAKKPTTRSVPTDDDAGSDVPKSTGTKPAAGSQGSKAGGAADKDHGAPPVERRDVEDDALDALERNLTEKKQDPTEAPPEDPKAGPTEEPAPEDAPKPEVPDGLIPPPPPPAPADTPVPSGESG